MRAAWHWRTMTTPVTPHLSLLNLISQHALGAKQISDTFPSTHPAGSTLSARFQANCHTAQAINTVFKHTTTNFSSARASSQHNSPFPHQHTCIHLVRFSSPSSQRFLFSKHINVPTSYSQVSSTSKHRSLTKQHIIAPLPTGAAPLSQQQAPRHFLTNNHLVRHLPINRHLMVSSATNTSSFLHHRS